MAGRLLTQAGRFVKVSPHRLGKRESPRDLHFLGLDIVEVDDQIPGHLFNLAEVAGLCGHDIGNPASQGENGHLRGWRRSRGGVGSWVGSSPRVGSVGYPPAASASAVDTSEVTCASSPTTTNEAGLSSSAVST